MSWHPERGSVLAADLLLGCVIVLILSMAAGAAGMIIDAGQSTREAARTGAVAIARGWDTDGAASRVRALALPGASTSVGYAGGHALVSVSVTMALPHPVARRLVMSIDVTESIPIAPYRSRRDG